MAFIKTVIVLNKSTLLMRSKNMNTLYIKKNVLVYATVLASVSLSAHAFDMDEVKNQQTPYAKEFMQLDTNADGQLNSLEALKDSTFNYQTFKAADKNSDGMLTQSEYAEVKAKSGQEKVEQVVDDSVITAKAKAKLLAEASMKSLKISVETYKGTVILSGFVSSTSLKEKAGEIVANIEGVKSVKNSLVVKG
jgi:hyperosmotically inducible periplasmic protein